MQPVDLELQPGETPFLRTARIMRRLKSANDSKIPGPHSSSGSRAYVQCTSPIRRCPPLSLSLSAALPLRALSLCLYARRRYGGASLPLSLSFSLFFSRLLSLSHFHSVGVSRRPYDSVHSHPSPTPRLSPASLPPSIYVSGTTTCTTTTASRPRCTGRAWGRCGQTEPPRKQVGPYLGPI